MIRRTTIELDEDLVARAKSALGCSTTRATVEEALRQAAERAEDETDARARAQLAYFERLDSLADLQLLATDSMWR